MLEVKHISFSYRRRNPLLQDISFRLAPGEILSLLGPNGSGKTTLLRCLLGMQRIRSGHITLDDRDIRHLNGQERARLLAYVPQSSELNFPYPVREVILMGRLPHLGFGRAPSLADHAAVAEVIDLMHLEHLADLTFQRLSGGGKQLVLIARAVAQQARILILDEPTSALDFANQAMVLRTLTKLAHQKYSIMFTTHSPDQALSIATSVLMLKKGALFAFGPTLETLTEAALSSLYETRTAVRDVMVEENEAPARVCFVPWQKERSRDIKTQ